MTQSLIEKIEAAIAECSKYPNTQSYVQGMNDALAIILEHQKGKLELEEISEEEAKKEKEVVGRWDCIGISEMFVPNYQVVTYDPNAEGWGVEWVDCVGQSQAVMYATPSKFYRLPEPEKE